MAIIKQPYPFGRLDQLDFQWEFQFPTGDTDSVFTYTLTPDPLLQVVSSSKTGNVITGFIALAAGAVVTDFQLLEVVCHMTSASTPPRKLDQAIVLQIKPT